MKAHSGGLVNVDASDNVILFIKQSGIILLRLLAGTHRLQETSHIHPYRMVINGLRESA